MVRTATENEKKIARTKHKMKEQQLLQSQDSPYRWPSLVYRMNGVRLRKVDSGLVSNNNNCHVILLVSFD